MDFRTAVIESLDRMIASDAITRMIEKAIGDTIAYVIKSELGSSYSDFGKKLTEAVKASLALNGSLDLPAYNDAVIKIAQKKMLSLQQDSLEMQVSKQLEKLLETAPAEITLSALVGQYVEMLRQRYESECGCEEKRITLIVEKSDHNFTYICLDEDPKKRRFECDIQLGVNRNEVFSLRLGGADVAKQLFVGPLYGFEKMLFQFHAAKTKVIFDKEPEYIETSYGGHE